VKIGDLVRYADSYTMRDSPPSPELGIITKTDPEGMPDRCHVEWFSCDNRGWWSYKNLVLVNENR
jgi:hypothetical protein